MRLFLLAVSLAALVALWWFLDDLLAMRAWVVMHRGAEPEITRGWPAVIAAWPVALAGVLLGGSGVFATLGWLMVQAEDHDHQRHLKHLQQRLDEAEQQAANAEQEARTALQTERDQVRCCGRKPWRRSGRPRGYGNRPSVTRRPPANGWPRQTPNETTRTGERTTPAPPLRVKPSKLKAEPCR
ncbi:hypothetical protein JII91_29870 (plasmid) [Klebsiella quasipneumoniae]|uniref:hypothetical protein n=1 Tax=Klebsiella quasipneumoniae TaxID=1463165 RepID=UPI001914E5A1|nr:hypothetical protein [Klebsiella quasipneumoniae]QQM83453.1 hypothetical protein JII91_29870 [Klebsiella quasipneumoniae]